MMAAQQYSRRRRDRRRLTRRGLIQLAALGGAGAASSLAFGCGGRPSSNPAAGGARRTAPSAAPRRGGTLNYAGGGAGSFDTQGRAFDSYIQSQLGAKGYTLFYERLVSYDLQTHAVQPELARKWEQPSPTDYIFHLQDGVKWQDKPPVNGRPLKAEDIRWSLERARTDDPKFTTRSLLTFVDTIEAPDASTIRLTGRAPNAGALTTLSTDNLAILAREVVEQYPKLSTAEAAIGTGAFILKSTEQNVGAEYVRNPNYWKPGLPFLDGLRTRHFPDTQTSYAALLAGQVDITLLPGSETDKYIAGRGSGYAPSWYADDTYTLLYPNTRQKPFDDARVRRALRLLVDHDEVINAWAKVWFGKGGYGSIFPTAFSAWDLTQDEYKTYLEWKQPKDDAAREALSLLSSAGYSSDRPLKFSLTSTVPPLSRAGAELIQSQWKRLSRGAVDSDVKLVETTAFDAIRANRTYTVAFIGQGTGVVDPDAYLSTTYRTGASQNFMDFSDPKLDAMIDKQRQIFDDQQRKAAVRDIILYMIDNGPSTVPANRYFLQAVKPQVQGQSTEYFINGRQYQSVWLSN